MNSGYISVFFWSLAILSSFWGYGELVRRWVNRSEFDALGWALTVTWGIGATIFLGGLLILFRIAYAPSLAAVVLLGLGLTVAFLALKVALSIHNSRHLQLLQRIKNPSNWRALPYAVPGVLLFLIAALAFSTSVFWPNQIDPNDDWVAYLMYPIRILQTGTFLDTFSIRRITALGGQSVLQAMVMVVGQPENGHILDRGIGALLLLGLMWQATRDVAKRWWFVRFLLIFATLAASVPRIHTGSHLLGIVLLLATLMTMSHLLQHQKLAFRDALPVAILLSGVSTLRPIFAMAGGGTLFFFYLWCGIKAPSGRRLGGFAPLVLIAGLTFALLLPYMIVSWQSSGTPMFPFSKGFGNEDHIFGRTQEGGWADWAAAFRFLSLPEIATMAIGLLVAGMVDGKQRTLAFAAGLAGFGMVVVSAINMSAMNTYDVYRFTYPLIAFPLFWILARALDTTDRERLFSGPVSTGLAVCVFFSAHFLSISRELQAEISAIPQQASGFKFPVAQLLPAYQALQSRVPAGEKIFVVVDAPYLLDFTRNPLDSIDLIGGASPPPGMPFGQGPEPLKKYLLGLGYRWAIIVDFDNAVLLYSRKYHANHPRQEWYMKVNGRKYFVDFMDNMDWIACSGIVATAGNTRLIRL